MATSSVCSSNADWANSFSSSAVVSASRESSYRSEVWVWVSFADTARAYLSSASSIRDMNSSLYPRSSMLSLRSCISWAATVSGSSEWAPSGEIISQPNAKSVAAAMRISFLITFPPCRLMSDRMIIPFYSTKRGTST